MTKKSDLAKIVAEKYHAGQKYGEHDYMYHLDCVASHFNNDERLQIIAYLHDTIEDTDLTYEDLECWFGVIVAKVVECLTRKQEEKYTEYIVRVSKNYFATQIKLADLEENMKNQTNESLMKRYLWASAYLRMLV